MISNVLCNLSSAIMAFGGDYITPQQKKEGWEAVGTFWKWFLIAAAVYLLILYLRHLFWKACQKKDEELREKTEEWYRQYYEDRRRREEERRRGGSAHKTGEDDKK